MTSPDRCPHCRSADLVIIRLSPAGSPLRFHTCRDCEHRWWTELQTQARVEVGAVLTLISAA